jgi:site-specific recombinase XerD
MSEDEVLVLKKVVEREAISDLRNGRTTWPRFWMMIDLATSSGMRVSEIASLIIGDIYLNPFEPRLYVNGKGDKYRDIFIPSSLRRHISDYIKWKVAIEEPTEQGDYLLLSSHGYCYTARGLQYAFKICLETAGLPSYYSIHACRHSYGTYLYQRTKNLRMVQKQLGHSSINTTTVYADVTIEETIKGVNGLFEGG